MPDGVASDADRDRDMQMRDERISFLEAQIIAIKAGLSDGPTKLSRHQLAGICEVALEK